MEDWRDIILKSVLILALGATTLAAAGSAFAGDHERAAYAATSTIAEGQRWGGGANTASGDRHCECSVPTVVVPFYTVRQPAPPIRVRAPGLRVSSAPVYAPSPSVYIQSPPIYVDAPPIQVAPAQVYLEAPDVHVRPSDVTVAPPEIHFTRSEPGNSDEHCCAIASPPLALGGHAAPVASGYSQEPGERG